MLLLNANNRQVFFLCVLLGVGGITALARVDSNWSYRRPNITVSHHQHSQTGYRPVGIGHQQPFVPNQTQWQVNNQTSVHSNIQQLPWQSNNNRTQFNQPVYKSTLPNPSTVNSYKPQQPAYFPGAFNQTRSTTQRPAATSPSQYPAYGQGSFNQTQPKEQQSFPPHYPQNPAYGNRALNQTRPVWPQPASPNYVHQLNQTRTSWFQPSAPQAPVYPVLPNNSYNRPTASSNSWTPLANQTRLYPQLPTSNLPQSLPIAGNSAVPLAPLQPQLQGPQGPHNWHLGGQAVLSYGPGYYPLPADNSNKNPPTHQGSSNPYANMFN